MEQHGPSTAAPSGRAVLLRGLDVLNCFVGPGPVLRILEITRLTGLPPATVHRLLAMLIEWGAVERVSRGEYRLAWKMWRLGSAVPQARELRDLALPFLEDLYETTHGVVHLAVRDGHKTMYVEKISGREAVRVDSRVGKGIPLHATGPGKVLLAHGGHDLFEQVVAAGLEKRSVNTITSPTQLRRVLADIRRSGYAVSREESSVGTASVAAPIFDAAGHVVASISVVTTIEEFDPAALTPAVCTVARVISRATGARNRLSNNGIRHTSL